ncbi:MAG TPA: hypothetical protein VJP45_15230, partial [Candidatus Limnocylindria bacterium]|nr:hypothetical protein [Candidatus Limnocylindria bacterium]
MSFARAAEIADAVLFEGYMLYPYRGSALKNRIGSTLGVVPPRDANGAAGHLGSELLVSGGPACVVEAKLRFLLPTAAVRGGDRAVAREVSIPPAALDVLERETVTVPFVFDDVDGSCEGIIALAAARHGATVKLSLTITNRSAARAEGAPAPSMVSTHVLLAVSGGEFVSLQDPPSSLVALAETCRQDGLWPILVGDGDERDLLIASPMIFEDHARIAPESRSSLFDGTEIEEMLRLRILTLADPEREEIAAGDSRVRALVERAEEMGPAQLAGLHGALRRPQREPASPRTLRVRGRDLGPGDRVRLNPTKRSDVMDVVLAGRPATIVSVEQDYDDRSYFAVTVDGDPGADLGALGKPG